MKKVLSPLLGAAAYFGLAIGPSAAFAQASCCTMSCCARCEESDCCLDSVSCDEGCTDAACCEGGACCQSGGCCGDSCEHAGAEQ